MREFDDRFCCESGKTSPKSIQKLGPAWARHGPPGQSAIHLPRFAEAAGKA